MKKLKRKKSSKNENSNAMNWLNKLRNSLGGGWGGGEWENGTKNQKKKFNPK